jgi:transposase
MTDGQWALRAPLLPAAGSTGGRGGRPEKWDRRLALDAIFHLVRGGIAWRALPADFPPHQTVRGRDQLPDRPRRRHRPDRQQRVRRREEDQGRKRHVAGGLLLAVVVTTASLQDRDGAFHITAALREAFSTITLVWADAGYAGRFVRDARKIWDWPWRSSSAPTRPRASSCSTAAGSWNAPSPG